MGRVSRDARLLFIMLWTIADDAGRARASSRLLASLLFPYDDDAVLKIPEWLMELERQDAIKVYAIEGNSYLQVTKWTDHQKIDHASASKLPAYIPKAKPRERSRRVREEQASGPEEFAPYLVPSTLDLGRDQEGKVSTAAGAANEPSDLYEAFALFNEAASKTNWSQIQAITGARRSSMRKRLRECGGIDGWRMAMGKALESDFLNGRCRRKNGHENWVPDIDFFLTQKQFAKLMEGSYDNRTSEADAFAAAGDEFESAAAFPH